MTSGSLESAAPTLAPATQQAQVDSQPQSKLNGVKGWLLWFCIALIVIQPILNFVEALGEGFDAGAFVLAWLLTGVSVPTGIAIIQRWKSTFTWLKWYFGIYAGVLALALIGTFSGSANVESKDTQQAITALVRGAIYILVWVSYFRTSKRVRATFGCNL
ncbi:MAG TPA: DUF2569 family protein [Terriglobales bacterium]|nr:DUF2569 family protein [Terriglobales bacterium]